MTTHFPSSISAGVTFGRTVVLTAYPAPFWTLSAVLRGPAAINITATAADNTHVFAVPADETADWAPGLYWYSLRVTDGADVIEVESGETTIRPDLAASDDPYDGRTHVRKVLEAIEAVIERRATQDQQRYTINNRELWRTPIPDLLVLRDRYRSELRRQQSAGRGGLFGQAVRVRFG